jgi:hypothetical protein
MKSPRPVDGDDQLHHIPSNNLFIRKLVLHLGHARRITIENRLIDTEGTARKAGNSAVGRVLVSDVYLSEILADDCRKMDLVDSPDRMTFASFGEYCFRACSPKRGRSDERTDEGMNSHPKPVAFYTLHVTPLNDNDSRVCDQNNITRAPKVP